MSAPASPNLASEALGRRNGGLFVWFRIFFNCRFYYPVYAVMFLDFGLTAEQFAWLNAAWAGAIVLLEVPSGALADHFGRRPLVIAASLLMVVEMAVLLAVPAVNASDPQWAGRPEALGAMGLVLFAVFLVNRVVSGAAEAAASGADEALAYDSYPPESRQEAWTALTVRLMHWQSVAFIFVTLIGAAIYDPVLVNRLMGWLGIEAAWTKSETLKLPILGTLLMSLGAIACALAMREPGTAQGAHLPLGVSLRQSLQGIVAAARWIPQAPAALMLLLLGLFFDSIIRLYYTVGSLYLTLLGFAERHFGLVSVAGSLSGMLAAWLGARLIKTRSPGFNFHLLGVLVFIGFFSLAHPILHWGVVFLLPLWLSMRLLHFFLSNYLNRVTDSAHRATVLSFRGLSMNLFYGVVTLLYGFQTRHLQQADGSGQAASPGVSEAGERIFAQAVSWWWIYFVAGYVALTLYRRWRHGRSMTLLVAEGEASVKAQERPDSERGSGPGAGSESGPGQGVPAPT